MISVVPSKRRTKNLSPSRVVGKYIPISTTNSQLEILLIDIL